MDEIWLFVLPTAAGALVQGLTGFGFGLVSIGLVGLLTEHMESGAGVVTAVSLVMLATLWWRSSRLHPVRWRDIRLLLVGVVLGLPVGYAFIAGFGQQPVFRLVLGPVLMVFAWVSWRGVRLSRPIAQVWAVPLGIVGGFISGAFVSGGPPLVAYLYSREPSDPRCMISSVQALFCIYTAMRFAAVCGRGLYHDPAVIRSVLWAIPLALLMLFVGYALAQRLRPRWFSALAAILIAVMGLLATVRAVGEALT